MPEINEMPLPVQDYPDDFATLIFHVDNEQILQLGTSGSYLVLLYADRDMVVDRMTFVGTDRRNPDLPGLEVGPSWRQVNIYLFDGLPGSVGQLTSQGTLVAQLPPPITYDNGSFTDFGLSSSSPSSTDDDGPYLQDDSRSVNIDEGTEFTTGWVEWFPSVFADSDFSGDNVIPEGHSLVAVPLEIARDNCIIQMQVRSRVK